MDGLQKILSFSENPYYQTKINEEGFYVIDSQYLPSVPYVIKYEATTGEKTTVKTSEFAVQNTTYLSSNKVNLNTGKKTIVQAKTDVVQKDPSVTQSYNSENENPAVSEKIVTPAPVSVSSVPSTVLPIVLILLILVGATAGLAGFYIYKNKKSNF